MEHNLEIIPVINKIDLATADIEGTKEQIEEELGAARRTMRSCARPRPARASSRSSRRSSSGFRRPPAIPRRRSRRWSSTRFTRPSAACVVGFRIMDGTLRPGDVIRFMSNNVAYTVMEVGWSQIQQVPRDVHERRRGRLPGGRHPDAGGRADRRYDDARSEPHRAKPARFRAGQADGLLLDLPDVRQRLRRAGGGDRALRPERRGAGLSEGLVGRPRPGLPLRVPRRAAPGCRAAAHRGGARHLARPDRAERGVPHPPDERRGRRGG